MWKQIFIFIATTYYNRILLTSFNTTTHHTINFNCKGMPSIQGPISCSASHALLPAHTASEPAQPFPENIAVIFNQSMLCEADENELVVESVAASGPDN